MKTLRLGAVVLLAVLSALVGCVSGGRGHGPVESFVIPAASNPGLPSDLAGQLNLGPEPKQVFLVVAPGTNVHALVAKLALNTEAVITVISSGTRVVQENGVTPNDFSAPVLYSIEVPGQKEPWRYRVTVRETETNPRLAQLVLPAGARLDPLFNPAVHSYRLEVPFASTKVRIEARAQSQFAKGISVDGAETPGPAAAAVVDFSSGQERPVTIETLAEDGITRERYVITLVRGAPDANALLGSLDLQGVPFSPVFTPAQLGYQAIVPFETQSLVVHALPQSPVATVALSAAVSISKGKAAVVQLVSSGDAAGASGAVVDFSQGNSLPLIVAVTAQDGSVQQYLIDIRRAPPDANNLLADLSLGTMAGAARLAPDFLPSRLRYTVVVPFSARQVRVMAHPQSRVAALQLGAGLPGAGGRGAVPSTGDPLSRDGALVDLPPAIERFPLLVTVTAQNGAALRYVVELRRAAPDRNSDLASLSVSGGALTPLFTPRVFSYAVALPPNVDTVKVGAAAAGPGATVTVAGQPGIAPSGSIMVSLSVAPGASAAIGLIVQAEDGSQKQYMVQVIRGMPLAPAQAAAQPAPQPPAQPTPPPVQPAPQPPQKPPVAAAPQQPVQQAQQPATVVLAPQQPVQPVPQQPAPAAPVQQAQQPAPVPPAQQPAPAAPAQQPAPATASIPPSATPPAATGTDHVVVSAKNLIVGQREAAALAAARETVGPVAKVTVRVYRSNQVLSQDSSPVDGRRQGGNLAVSLQYRSVGVSLGRDRLVEVEVLIPTTAGHALYYKEAMPAADEVSMDVPFLLYTAAAPIAWPAVGSPVQTAGYVSWAPAGRDKAGRAEDREDFQKNGKGEYGINIEITDAKTGRSYGKDTVWRKPGLARGQALRFTGAMSVPEGAEVGYVLTAQAKNGRTWSATGQAQVWTTRLRYEGGFEPVLLPISDELAPAPAEKGDNGPDKEKKR